jgi:hypothetical protein
LWITSRTVSGSVKTTSLILAGLIRWAESKTIWARRQVTTEPESRRTIRSSRLPSSLVISRSSTLAAISASDRRLRSEDHFGGGALEPGYENRQTLVVTPLAASLGGVADNECPDAFNHQGDLLLGVLVMLSVGGVIPSPNPGSHLLCLARSSVGARLGKVCVKRFSGLSSSALRDQIDALS